MRSPLLCSRGTAVIAGALLLAAGCSFVSSPDDLAGSGGRGETAGAAGVEATAGNAGASGRAVGGAGSGGAAAGSSGNPVAGNGGNAGNAGASAGGLGGAAGAGGDAGNGGASGGGGAGGPSPGGAAGTAGQGGASGTAGSAGQAGVATGALVMGGVASGANGTSDVLVVLDPKTGKELSRETMVVAAVAHDAAGDEDRWFIFQSKGFAEPTPTDEIVLHIRTLDAGTGTWTPVAQIPVPSLVIGSVVVLNNRLAYLGYAQGAPSQRRLVVIETTPGKYGEVAVGGENAYTTAGATGLVGIRSLGTPGGTLDVVGVTAAPCGGSGGNGGTAGSCEVSLRPITVDPTGVTSFAAKKALSFPYSAGAQATWTASTANNEIYIASPGQAMEQPFLRRFSPAGVTALGQAVPFDATGRTFRSMSFDECNGLAFLTELNADQAVFAIPAKKVAPAAVQSLGKPGQRVLYEPTTRSVIVPFSQGGTHSLRAFTVDASPSPPTLTERSGASWSPPDIAPGPIAVRNTSACP